MYLDEWKNIVASAPNNDPLQIPPFSVQVVFGTTTLQQAHLDILQYAEFTEDSMNAAQGEVSLKVTVPIIIGGINHKY